MAGAGLDAGARSVARSTSFGTIWTAAAIFCASLTELEAAGLLAASAPSIGTGKSMELAQEEWNRAATLGVRIVALDDAAYHPG